MEVHWTGGFHLGQRDYCPCESGKRLGACGCLKESSFCPPSVNVTPRGEVTKYSNPECYLRTDENCSRERSREHFISKSILAIIERTNGRLTVSGFPWQTEPKDVGIRTLTCWNLCKRHNEALSPLDVSALRFYRHLSGMYETLYGAGGGTKTDQVALFNGRDLERWMLKVLCGFVTSGNAVVDGEKRVLAADAHWCDLVMGRKVLPQGLGLWATSNPGDVLNTSCGIGFAPLFGDHQRLGGISMEINGIRLALALCTVINHKGTVLDGALFRPTSLLFVGEARRVMLKFGWNGYDSNKDIVIEWRKQGPRVEPGASSEDAR
jgi:hypothetical protein